MVADWDCIVRKLVRVADGRVKPWVKPGHDEGGEPILSAPGSADDLAPLLRHIQRDPRHSHFHILERREIVTRSMAYVAKSDGTMGHPLAHFEFEAALTNGATPEAKKLLTALRRVVAGRVEAPVVD